MERGGIWGAHGVPAPESRSEGASRCVCGGGGGGRALHSASRKEQVWNTYVPGCKKDTDLGSWYPRG